MSKQVESLPFNGGEEYAKEVIDVTVGEEMSESFLAYSLSVITSRAIPDIRDGLKPVQRRILYSMLQQGIRPDGNFRKCAGVVGDTMGKYHPHGDSAIYETLVRMGQDFTRNVTFIHPQGNFGSLDDPPAAYRYTECKLTEAAMDMVGELDEDTVAFRPTFDGDRDEPLYLPALIPNLLVNGTSGIAVGMATNMPTHNLREVYTAIELVMTKRRPRPTIDELLAVIPGPDFPSGGMLIDEGIREAFETGRGTVRIRARAQIEQVSKSRQGIIVTELPYMVGPQRVIAKIKELNENGKIAGIADFKDLTDRHHGLRIQVEVKPGFNPQAVLQDLYRLTPLEETFGINNVVLIDGVPTTVGIYELCQHYITHRLDVIVRRTQFRLAKAQTRLHILEGLLIALDAIDEVIRIIRSSQDTAEARSRLIGALSLSEIQATHILDMQLRRLTALEKLKIEEERDRLLEEIDRHELLLGSEQRQRTLVLKELKEAVDAYGSDRKTQIVSAGDIPVYEHAEVASDDIEDQPCVITLSTSGQIGWAPTEGAKRATPGRHDVLTASTLSTTASFIWAVTSEGRALKALAVEFGEVAGRGRGAPAAQVFGTNRGEDILTIVSPETENLVVITQNGIAKRLSPDELRTTKADKPIISLKDGDKVAAAFTAPEGVDIIIVASDAQVLRTAIDGISVQGRGAAGVAGMKLKGNAKVVGAGPILGDEIILTISDASTAKVTESTEIPSKGRGTGGVRITRFAGESRIDQAVIGSLANTLAVMGSDDNPTKPDPIPVPITIPITKRDLVSTPTDRPMLSAGPARW